MTNHSSSSPPRYEDLSLDTTQTTSIGACAAHHDGHLVALSTRSPLGHPTPSFFPSAFLPVLPGAMWVYSLASAQAFMTQAILNSFVLAFSLNRAYRSGLGIHCAGARGCVLTRCRFDRCRSMMFWKSGRSKEQRWFYSVMLVS